MSRICVKNLAKKVTEKQLRDLFETKGEITDCKLLMNKDGKFRGLAFIGFRSEDQALEAVKYFNNSFLGLAKISVEIAKKINDPALQKIKEKKSKQNKQTQAIEESKNVFKTTEGIKKDEKTVEYSKKKKEFIEMMKSRTIAQTWANDEVIPEKSPEIEQSENDFSSDDLNQLDNMKENELKDQPKPVIKSDLDYLKSKVTSFSDSEEEDDDIKTPKVQKKNEQTNDSNMDQVSKLVDKGLNKEMGILDTPAGDTVLEEQDNDKLDENRLFVKNIPFTCSEEELQELFEKFGKVSEVHISLNEEKRSKGFGFIHFLFPENAQEAMANLDGSSFQGRVLRISMAQKPKEKEIVENGLNKKLSSYQKQKEIDKKKNLLLNKEGWNAAYVRSDTVVESIAERHNTTSAAVLDPSLSGGDLAVCLAVGETQVIAENKDFFTQNGVNLDGIIDFSSMESNNAQKKAIKRSNHTLLIKNLPHNTAVDELENMFSRFGSLGALLLAPSKTLAVVDFLEPSEARNAFKGLAYRKYKHTPLYLEWAPVGSVNRDKAAEGYSKLKTGGNNGKNENEEEKKKTAKELLSIESGQHDLDYSTLFVKNLNFSTTESKFREHVLSLGVEGLRTVIIQKKMKGTVVLSQGYGFIEFESKKHAMTAEKKINGSLLEGHALECKASDKSITKPNNPSKPSNNQKKRNKLLVRNLAFQATKKELHSLFAVFGSVKRVRLPKKLGADGSSHRGFAFVELATSQEAEAAMSALANTHLYGRHLVIEWAKEDESEAVDDAGNVGGSGSMRKGSGTTGLEMVSTGETTGLSDLRKRARQDERNLMSEKKRKNNSDSAGAYDNHEFF